MNHSVAMDQVSSKSPPLTPNSVRFPEFFTVTLLLAAILGGQIFLTGSKSLLSRPLWLDELMTYRLAADPDLSHAIAAVGAAVDSGPPIRILMLRAFCELTGGIDEIHMRLFSLTSALAALAGAYLLSRRVARPSAAFLAALAMGTHPLMLDHQFQCRFYSTFVAAVVWFSVFFVQTKRGGRRQLMWNIATALAATLVCTLHYFGIFSLALVLSADFMFDRRPWRVWLIRAIPVLAGPIALAASLPFYYSQRAAMTVPTWIPVANLAETMEYFRELLALIPLTILVAAYFLSEIFFAGSERIADGENSIAGLTGLLLLPMAVWLVSVVMQPALLTKYAIGTVVGFLPLFAFLARRANRSVLIFAIALMAGIGAINTVVLCRYNQAYTDSTNSMIAALRSVIGSEPFVFAHSDEFCAVNKYAPELAARSLFLDFETGKSSAHPPTDFMISERDIQRSASRFYPDYQMANPDDLKRVSRFVLIASPADLPIIQSMDNSLTFHRLQNGLIEAMRK
jgi:uncharacterized membrane protein